MYWAKKGVFETQAFQVVLAMLINAIPWSIEDARWWLPPLFQYRLVVIALDLIYIDRIC